METKLMTITPEMAIDWLGRNRTNRKLSQRTVQQYTEDMAAGRWVQTHQGIAFDTEGNLIDGQHRLVAVVRAKKPIEMLVSTGVEKTNGMLVVDNGRKRSIADQFRISGYEEDMYSNKAVIAFANLLYRLFVDKNGKSVTTAGWIRDFLDRRHDQCKFIYKLSKDCRIPAAVLLAVYLAKANGEKPEALKSFCQCYAKNAIDPMYYSKKALDLHKFIGSEKDLRTAEVLFRCETAIHGYIHNKPVEKIQEFYPGTPYCL